MIRKTFGTIIALAIFCAGNGSIVGALCFIGAALIGWLMIRGAMIEAQNEAHSIESEET